MGKSIGLGRSLAVLAVGTVGVAASRGASAHGDMDVERPSPGGSSRDAASVEPDAGAPAGTEGEPRSRRAGAGVDLVFGWGNVPFAVQNLPGTGNQTITYSRSDATPSSVQSFVLSGLLEAAAHLTLGVRLPLTFASFSPNGSASRSTTALGNIELEGEFGAALGARVALMGSLGVALPTAQGDALPPGTTQQSAQLVDESAYDRFSLSRAAASARGHEDDALFEPHRLGLTPKLGLVYRARGVSIEPYVKLENLVGTSSALDPAYLGELVSGVRVGYELRDFLEVGLRGWDSLVLVGSSGGDTISAAVEPEVLLRSGFVRLLAGVIVPVGGAQWQSGFVGVRLGVSGVF
jgi:hypothetical protein